METDKNKEAPTRDRVAVSARHGQEVKSRHTGRVSIFNEHEDQFLVHQGWSKEGVAKAMAHWRTFPVNKEYKPIFEKTLGPAVAKLETTEDLGSFVGALNHLLVGGFHDHEAQLIKCRQRVVNLMVSLWLFDCVVWPSESWVLPRAKRILDEEIFSPKIELLKGICGGLRSRTGNENVDNYRVRCLLHFLMNYSVLQDVGDIAPSTKPPSKTKSNKDALANVLTVVIRLQNEAYPNVKAYAVSDFGWAKNKAATSRSDVEFKWAIQTSSRAELWRQAAADFVAVSPRGREHLVYALNMWLDHVIEHESISANPVDFFTVKTQANLPPLGDVFFKNDPLRRMLHNFMQFTMEKHCSIEDDHGIVHVPIAFRNPIANPLRTNIVRAAETHREPMPTRFINQCLQILTKDDFAWPKKVGAFKTQSDWIKWLNPETKEFELVWCPARTILMILKFLLPARTFQLLMLDSGEGDSEVYDHASGLWAKNSGPHAPAGKARVEKGVFRKYQRKDVSFGSLIYLNTNKTADLNVDVDKRGFVMAWEHTEALKYLGMLRDWQAKYNPLRKPTLWRDVKELHLKRSPEDLERLGAAYFLFRDPSNPLQPNMPMSDQRPRSLWVNLMQELERRLAAQGDALPNGQPIKLITSRNARGQAMGTLFDLHTLRVTMITALYEHGVPPEVIMKIVGHASVMMTLYYTKISAQSISDALNKASLRRQQDEQSNWIGFLQTKSREHLQQLSVASHSSALDSFAGGSGASLVVMDHGICTMGAKKCHEGLATTTYDNYGAKHTFNPVPGGAGNCVRCRFFMTGPAFLLGQEAHINDLAYRLKNKSSKFHETQSRFDEISMAQEQSHAEGAPRGIRELQIAEAAFEKSTAEVDDAALSLQAAYHLMEQSLMLLESAEPEQPGFSLVVSGDAKEKIQAVLEEVAPFEQLHRICTSATLFEGLQIDDKLANLERFRFFDRMLAKSGMAPRFSFIEDDRVAARIATEMGNFLYSRLSKRDVDTLMDGRSTLASFGLVAPFKEQLRLANMNVSTSPLQQGNILPLGHDDNSKDQP